MSNAKVPDTHVDGVIASLRGELITVGAVSDKYNLSELVARLNGACDPRVKVVQLYRNLIGLKKMIEAEE